MTTFYLLDLDRTILDTEKASALLIDLVAKESPKLAASLRIQVDVYNQHGTPFAIRDVIAEQVGEETAARLEEVFIDESQRQYLLLEGAEDLFAYTDNAPERSFGILTYGSPKGQMMKLKATKLDTLPLMITQQKHKGELIMSWKVPDGYQLPSEYGGQLVDQVVLVDDRIFSFEGLPNDVRGYWVTDDLSLLDTVEHAANVKPVYSLQEVIDNEQRLLAD